MKISIKIEDFTLADDTAYLYWKYFKNEFAKYLRALQSSGTLADFHTDFITSLADALEHQDFRGDKSREMLKDIEAAFIAALPEVLSEYLTLYSLSPRCVFYSTPPPKNLSAMLVQRLQKVLQADVE